MMKTFKCPEHQVVVEALSLMDHAFLLANECWFGEYRRSLDVDFLCASADGYRELRSAAAEKGIRAFFPVSIKPLRDMRIDQYGLRTIFAFKDQQIKFEIIREARIALKGIRDPELNIPILAPEDMFAEKLLANADRCQDRAVAIGTLSILAYSSSVWEISRNLQSIRQPSPMAMTYNANSPGW